MPRTQLEVGGAGQGKGAASPGEAGWEECPSAHWAGCGAGRVLSLAGVSGIVARAKVGVSYGAHGGLVPLTGQAPLTGTRGVNPTERPGGALAILPGLGAQRVRLRPPSRWQQLLLHWALFTVPPLPPHQVKPRFFLRHKSACVSVT